MYDFTSANAIRTGLRAGAFSIIYDNILRFWSKKQLNWKQRLRQ